MRARLVVLFSIAFACAATAQAELNDGLVAYYPFNGTANDESGNENHGIVHGATLCEDRHGSPNRAFCFDGVDDVIEIPDDDTLDLIGPISIAAWVLPTAFPATRHTMIVGKSNYLTLTNYLVRILPGGYLQWEYGVYHETTANPLQEGAWVHITVTAESPDGTGTIYVNATPVAHEERPSPFGTVDDPVTIGGASHPFYSEFFSGRIDDVRLYHRALTEIEVGELYSLLFADGFESGTVGAWSSAAPSGGGDATAVCRGGGE